MTTEVLCNQVIAANIDKQLRNQARGVAHSMERFKSLIAEAKARCIYPMLGFKSWTTYIADVIDKEMHQLPVDDRRQIVALLADEGMSNRAIADAVGVNEITVRRDKEQVRQNVAPAEVAADQKLTPIVGRDNKCYLPKEREPEQKPRRKPITDAFDHAVYELGKVTNRLARLADDDRFDRNRSAIASRRLSDLQRAGHLIDEITDKVEDEIVDQQIGDAVDA